MSTHPTPPTSVLRTKRTRLRDRLQGAGRLVVAYSGGVDSAYLALAAREALGSQGMLAVTAVSPSYPEEHRRMAERVAREFAIPHRMVETREMERADYRVNAPDRCYHCKSELFATLARLREELGFSAMAYGINTDDRSDFRPGHRAAAERGVLAPLLEADLSKAEIRALSREAGLPTADLPASACLASRLPYGTEVTETRLRQVEEGERRVRALGFRQVRVRNHGELARIEVAPDELSRALAPEMARALTAALRPLGFRYVTLDLEGYRTGSLNEVLPLHPRPSR